jgi:hypothetical protein
MQPVQEIDYLIVGHVCQDMTPEGPRLGGTVAFSALTAQSLGLRVGILTSAPANTNGLLAPLQAVPLVCVPSEQPTTFKNIYTPTGRVQMLLMRAEDLHWHDLPAAWRRPTIVHLAPVANEVDPAMAGRFDGALIGATPQGWMRCWDEFGQVSFQPWLHAHQVLDHAQAIVLSLEDVEGDEDLIDYLAEQADAMVVTRGRDGCTLHIQGQSTHIPAPHVEECDPTGAGDIFAAAFFAHLKATNDLLVAARFATLLASDSVTRSGLDSIPCPATIQDALSAD